MHRRLAVFSGTAAVGAVTLWQKINSDEGLQRSMQFWKGVGPIYGHYRYIQFLNKDISMISDSDADERYERLHEIYSEKVRDITYQLRGFYLKNAQIMSTQDDFVPSAYMKWVKDTQSNVPSEWEDVDAPRRYCSKIMKEEQGLDFEDIFDYWDPNPLGVASIAQVHKARLRATGESVAVKLQFPNMENRFRADIATLKGFCSMAMPQFVASFNEIEKQFSHEFDFRTEARNLEVVRNSVMPKWGGLVCIPAAHLKYCSRHMLTMNFLRGVELVDGIKASYQAVAKKTGKSLEDLEAEKRVTAMQQGESGLKTLAEESNSNARIRWAIFLGDIVWSLNAARFVYNISPLSFIYGSIAYEWTPPPLDLGRILETLCQVHAFQLFEGGAFNADPHPGNVLLLPDGRLGLIDYGQVKYMSTPDRIIYAKLMLAHAANDKKEVARIHFEDMGAITKKRDFDIAYLHNAFWNDRDTADITKGMNHHVFNEWLQEQDPIITLPDEFIMAGRLNILLRGMGKAFGLKIKMSKVWEQQARDFLQRHGDGSSGTERKEG
jgi:aarF domain-containing kinase